MATLKRSAVPSIRAFTLIELLVVVTIMGLLAGIGIPAMKGFGQTNAIKAATQQLTADVALARMKAITERTTVYMVFISSNILDSDVLNTLKSRSDLPGLRQWTNLVRGQYTTYALFTERSVGAQPGQTNPRYLTEWKSLPDKMFLATRKFTDLGDNSTAWQGTPATDRPFAYRNFPVPYGKSPAIKRLPYIAFNSMGQVVYPSNSILPRDRDECLPLAQGSIFYPQAANGAFQPADVVEKPAGNSINNFNRVRISWLTGRARLEQPQIQ
jgi:prepilin-type N-terminal cleavage/methylation domain-containing protein